MTDFELAQTRDHLLDNPKLNPNFVRKAKQLLLDMRKDGNGHAICVVEAYRSPLTQMKLYLKGITTIKFPTYHINRAMDCAFFVNGKLTYDVPKSWWLQFGDCAVKKGLEWSGNWKRNKEFCHVQLKENN